MGCRAFTPYKLNNILLLNNDKSFRSFISLAFIWMSYIARFYLSTWGGRRFKSFTSPRCLNDISDLSELQSQSESAIQIIKRIDINLQEENNWN